MKKPVDSHDTKLDDFQTLSDPKAPAAPRERRGRVGRAARGTLALAVVCAALSAAPAPAAAEAYYHYTIDRRGFYIGFAGMGNFVVNQARAPVNGFIDQGGGFSFMLGWRVAPMFALEAAYTLSIHNPVQEENGEVINVLLLHAFTFDGKLIFPNRSVVRPFLQAGFGVYELATHLDGAHYRNGLGFQLGGGLDIWVSRTVSIGGRALYHGIFFTQYLYYYSHYYSSNYKPFLSTVSVELNLQIHF